MDAIGAMRARLRLRKPTRVADEIGGGATSWSDAGEIWAELTVLSAEANTAFDAGGAQARFNVRINRRDDIRAGWRALWGARTLRILAVRNEGGARIDLVAEEEVL
ncbi:MAG: phage head closure protein [Hyphomonadaceae bacterium]|nr:phage head closure protein [Hyphomonadaceae bacterium]